MGKIKPGKESIFGGKQRKGSIFFGENKKKEVYFGENKEKKVYLEEIKLVKGSIFGENVFTTISAVQNPSLFNCKIIIIK